MERLRAEATELGAHGIVGIRIDAVNREALSHQDWPVYEVRASATAVRSPSSPPSGRVFTAATSGSHVAQLLRHGYAPSEAVLGVAIVRADQANATRKRLRSTQNGEVSQFSEAVQKCLDLAFLDLERRAADHGELVAGTRPEVHFDRPVGAGLEVRVTALGTAVCRFDIAPPGAALPMLRLNEPRAGWEGRR